MRWLAILVAFTTQLSGFALAQPQQAPGAEDHLEPDGSILGGARPYFRPMPAQGLLDFMNALHKQGLSVADINLMAKTNPARVLGLEP